MVDDEPRPFSCNVTADYKPSQSAFPRDADNNQARVLACTLPNFLVLSNFINDTYLEWHGDLVLEQVV
jgi:hypothetical protein